MRAAIAIQARAPGLDVPAARLCVSLNYAAGFDPGVKERRRIEWEGAAALEAWLLNWKAANVRGTDRRGS